MKLPDRPKKPLQFVCLTLPWKQLPDYPDVGSYKMNEDNSPAFIGCADTGNDISNFAILIHEQVEAMWCWLNNVKEKDVSGFDQKWFKENHRDDEEPGNDIDAPYHIGHLIAERFEREILRQFGVMWQSHCDRIKTTCQS